jgi:glycerol-3-phosphate dehydrogenase
VDALIVGGGVTGLAAANALSAAGCSTCIVERHPRPGMESSTHNSGVIHAGLYYPEGSLKARLCVEGASLLYEFCGRHEVPCDRCGKFVIATDDAGIAELERLHAVGTANGVNGLAIVDADFVRSREPCVRSRAALWSPHTGRVDANGLVRALLRSVMDNGGMFLCSTSAVECEAMRGGFRVRLERETVEARTVVNAAGLHADEVSAAFGCEVFRIYPCRGDYAALKRSRLSWVNGLVYPVPHPSGHGLGVHLTRTLDGSVLLGPTIRYQERKDDYESAPEPLETFVEAVRPLLPGLTVEDIIYAGSGIRAKLHPPGERFADFMIRRDRLQPALIHAGGIDSPGLTASLAVGRLVAGLVQETLD